MWPQNTHRTNKAVENLKKIVKNAGLRIHDYTNPR